MFVNLVTTSALLQMPTTTGYGVGLNVVQAGLAMLPTAVAMVVLAPVAGRLTGRYGPRFTLILASLTFCLGYALRAGFSNSVLQISLGAVVCGCANLLAFSALPVSIMRSVPVSQTSAANGVNTVARYLGMASASAAVAAVLAAASVPVGDRLLPTQDAFEHIFVLAALAGAAAGIITLFLPRAGSRPAVSEEVAEGVLVNDI
jgi:MFS family permease